MEASVVPYMDLPCLQEENAALLVQWRPQLLRVLLRHAQHFQPSLLAESLLHLQTQQKQKQHLQQNAAESLLRQLVDWLQQQYCKDVGLEQRLEGFSQQQLEQKQQEEPPLPLAVLLDLARGFIDAFLPVGGIQMPVLGFTAWDTAFFGAQNEWLWICWGLQLGLQRFFEAECLHRQVYFQAWGGGKRMNCRGFAVCYCCYSNKSSCCCSSSAGRRSKG